MLAVYLAVTGVILIAGRSRVAPVDVMLHLTLLAVVACAAWIPAAPLWLRLWVPLMTLPFLYAEMPAVIAAAGQTQLFDARVMGWESAIFGGQPARTWAMRWASRGLSELLHAAYLSYYAIIFSVPLALWLSRRRREFADAVLVLMLTFVVCFLIYVVFPVAGPRYLWPTASDSLGGPVRSAALWVLETGSSRGTAFPSSHVAVAVTQSALAFRYFGLKGIPLAVLAAGLGIGAIYGGFHYAIDVIAGVVVGGVICAIGVWATSRATKGSLLDRA